MFCLIVDSSTLILNNDRIFRPTDRSWLGIGRYKIVLCKIAIVSFVTAAGRHSFYEPTIMMVVSACKYRTYWAITRQASKQKNKAKSQLENRRICTDGRTSSIA